MDHDVHDLGYELTFSIEIQEFGVTEVRDLKPNGRNIVVTEDVKHEYVHLVCQEKMTGSIKKQLNAFLEGFYEIIPKRLISIFNEQELELLISGLPNVDIDDLKANTEYHKYQSSSLQIQWFWRALRSFDQADRAKFLQFVTGTSKVPLQGFAALEGMNGSQKFQIHRDDRSTDRLPSAHTWLVIVVIVVIVVVVVVVILIVVMPALCLTASTNWIYPLTRLTTNCDLCSLRRSKSVPKVSVSPEVTEDATDGSYCL